MENELTCRIAGGSGDGIDTTGKNLSKALMRSGLDVFTHRHFPSRIRGGHTYYEIRASKSTVMSRRDEYDALLALGDSFARSEEETAVYGNEEIKPLTENLDALSEGGVIVYDTGLIDTEELPDDFDDRVTQNDWSVVDINLYDIARKHGRQVMRNTAGVGVLAELLDFDPDNIRTIIEETMSGDIKSENIAVFDAARDSIDGAEADPSFPSGSHAEEQALVSGSHAVAYGAIDEGVQFVSGYPMTPWTDVFTILSQHLPEMGGIAEQVEDEIAAITTAIGASHAGVKALSGSSGGGFSLMSEALGMSEMTETPLVLVEAMRAGPSTGLPTKPGQGDLEQVLYSSQGDSNRVVFAPGNIRESYEQTRLAVKLAYDYQIPSIVLIDQKISGEMRNVPASFFRDRTHGGGDLGAVLTEDDIAEADHHDGGTFARYGHTDGVVQPRSLPGQKGGRFLAAGNEHDEYGQISEDIQNRTDMHSRRMEKTARIRSQLADDHTDTLRTVHGDIDRADIGILTFGTQQGAAFEATRLVSDTPVAALGLSQLAPFPTTAVQEFIDQVDICFIAEMNATAQLKGLVRQHVERRRRPQDVELVEISKFNGNPLTPTDIADEINTTITDD